MIETQTIDERKSATESPKTDNIWQALKVKAQVLGYGEWACKVVVHEGQIKEVDIKKTIEKIR